MSTDPYDEILKRAINELTSEQQQRLAEMLFCHVARKNCGKQSRITDLDGLGKEIWQSVDADEYVAKQRGSWDG